MNPTVEAVTDTIRERSLTSRAKYLEVQHQNHRDKPQRDQLGCTNLAHAYAGMPSDQKTILRDTQRTANIGIVSAYNDMLSAHQPYERFPTLLKKKIRSLGSSAQFAGGVPAMCDGVTQGEIGMELSLFSRDTIAMSTAVSLSHHVFDGILCLGICDKIVPGLVMGALSFGHLPTLMVPAGPMPSGLPNKNKAQIRQQYAEGKISKSELLKSEEKAYHSPGTCTFYGTANSNQMLMEMMGMQLPGSSFVNPNTEFRDALTEHSAARILEMTALSDQHIPLCDILDEKAFVNGIVGLLATGGSTNHTLHIVAMARAAGILINWDDFSKLAEVTPLIARVYPNGEADINHFQAAGGMAFTIQTLLEKGLVHNEVNTVVGKGLERYTEVPDLTTENTIEWQTGSKQSSNNDVLRSADSPFQQTGGLSVLDGNLGRAVIKTSAVPSSIQSISAPAMVFESQQALMDAFKQKQLEKDFVAVLRYQGPAANGMPELHKLNPILGSLQDRGFKVAVVTDGRMSGASGKVPAVIHLTPEALHNETLAKVQDGDLITIDWQSGVFTVDLPDDFEKRDSQRPTNECYGVGRELFSCFRNNVSDAESGATINEFYG